MEPATGDGRRFERHVFICTKGPHCPNESPADEVLAALKAGVRAEGLDVRINHSGCLDQCGHGSTAVVYPEGVWYAHLGPEDASRIVTSHLRDGEPVDDLRYRTGQRSGKNKVPRMPDGGVDRDSPDYHPCNRCPH